MQSSDFDRRMRELLARIEELPDEERAPLYALAQRTRERQAHIDATRARSEAALKEMRRANGELHAKLERLQGKLMDLRLDAKLALFDLEASRRERDAGA
jgi:predicted nuclease with TOPRIM domain